VQDDGHGLTLRRIPVKQLHDRQGLSGIERCDRLIRQQEESLHRKRPGEQNARAFAP